MEFMGGKIQCFFLTPTGQAQESLRRFTFSKDKRCPKSDTGHDASSVISEFTKLPSWLAGKAGGGRDDYDHDDPGWPKICEKCGEYEFQDEDQWQHNVNRLYSRSDNGLLVTLHNAPVGAMWDAHWLPYKGPDGKSLVLRTPAGDWQIDGPSSDGKGKTGPGWTRRGVPPLITVRPSIGMQNVDGKWQFHAFLTNGVLERLGDSVL